MFSIPCYCLLAIVGQTSAPDSTPDRATVIVVTGAAGEDEFGKQFARWGESVAQTAEKGGARVVRLGVAGKNAEGDAGNDREQLRTLLAELQAESPQPVWLIFFGHGAFDRRKATFNLQGPDISADDLATWLAPVQRTVAVVNCAACSGPFINRLAAPERIVVTATRSGSEQNFAHFGEYFSQAVGDLAADLDKDQQVSLLEAYLAASNRVEEFYKQEGRLATEHALLDDTGDGLGTPADWFHGVRATRAAKDGAEIDGLRASQLHLLASAGENALSPEQRAARDALEAKVEALRAHKPQMPAEQYYAELEALLVPLARLYTASESAPEIAKPQ